MNPTDSELRDAVLEDIRCHRENGVDLNPYSTDGSRHSWQTGFDGKPLGPAGYFTPHRRGKLAAQIIKEQA